MIEKKIAEVSKSKQVSQGYKQNYFIINDFEILMNQLTTEASLKGHSHEFAQFGFCFEGAFEFEVGNSIYTVNKGDSYNIRSNISHGAKVLQDIIALDFKYTTLKEKNDDVKLNVLSDQIDGVQVFELDEISIAYLKKYYAKVYEHYTFKSKKRNFIIPYKNTKLIMEKHVCKVENNKIYEIKGYQHNEPITLGLEGAEDIIILQVK